MLMNQVLDSSNSLRDSNQRSRPLKRSASVASLPTPPRTHHKRSRSRARSSVSHHDSDSGSASELDDDFGDSYAEYTMRAKAIHHSQIESDNDELSEDENPSRKRRRTLVNLPGHDEEEEDENAFWTGRVGRSAGENQETKTAQVDKTEESSPSPAMLRYRVKAPVSPPPSRRQPVFQPARAASVEREETLTHPVTPPRRLFLRAPSPFAASAFKTPTKPKATKIWPKRDSPNNPFLVESSEKGKLASEWDSTDDDDDNEVVGEARVREGTPTPTFEEKPTITYVFRGQKATFHNPLFGLAPEVIAASKLPVEHPDFEAAESCPPKRLFSAGKRKSRDRSRENNSSEGVKRAKVERSDHRDENSEGEQSSTGTESPKNPSHADSAETATVPPKHAAEPRSRQVDDEELQNTRKERERRETIAKSHLAFKDGLRAGAVFAERDEPARRAIGPLRSA